MATTFSIQRRKLRIYCKRHLKFDLVAGLVVFLVAIPLCLGIALASGAPLFSGILSGIIGGIVVGSLSGSAISVSGPAAGLTTVVFSAIGQLGSFQTFLLALVLAGVIQIIIGFFRAGFIAEYIPLNVIQGLLCAIGILIIIKQLPFAFTLSHTLAALETQLIDLSEGFSYKPLHDLSFHINCGAMIISISSLVLLILFDNLKQSWIKALPGALMVVIFSIVLNEIFELTNLSVFAQNGPHLVKIPQHDSFADFFAQMHQPNWSAFNNLQVYIVAIIIAVIASLENLLNLKGCEKLDKKRRYFSKDRELIAQGIGNCLAGLVGGIPMTSVILRSSINIQSGARTKMATIFHGCFILLAVILIPSMLNKIPLSALAAILIYTGYKLAKPTIFISIYRQGLDRFVPFIVTVIGILFLNLLFGILLGLIVSLFFILKSNSEVRLDIIKEIYPTGITHRLVLPQQTTFLNKASLMAELNSIPKKSQLIIDARYSTYIDKEIIQFIKEFQQDLAIHKQISLNLIGFKDRYKIHDYIDFINVTTYDAQTALTPCQILNILKEGNQRFLHDTCIHRTSTIDIEHTASTQYPMAMVLGCIDSRVPVETVLDMSVGDLFCSRVAGNVVNNDILASIEYACAVIGSKLIVVLGHTRCGAIKAACDNVQQGHITELLTKIKPAIEAETITEPRTGENEDFVTKVTYLNVANTIYHIYSESSILRQLIDEERIGIIGAIYDVQSGEIKFQDCSSQILQLNVPNSTQLIEKIKNVIS